MSATGEQVDGGPAGEASESAPTMIIFGCGYIGAALVGEALAQGWSVTLVSRTASRMAPFAGHARVRRVVADLTGAAWRNQVPHRADLVVNCISGGGGSPAEYRQAYVEGMHSIAAWAEGTDVDTFLYTSSTGVYPQTAGETVREKDAATPETASERQRILLEAEAIAQSVPARRKVILRLAGIYGPGRHYLMDRLIQGETRFEGTGDFYLNLIHRDDAVSAILAAFLARLPPGAHTFNLCDGHPGTKAELVEWLAARLGAQPPVFDPSLESPRARRRLGPGGNPPHRRIDGSAFESAIGWTPRFRSYEEGYAPLLESHRLH